MTSLKVLIDTNILIGLEDSKEIHSSFSEFQKKCNQYGVQIFVHEASRSDIERDKNSERKQIMLSKLGKFLPLEGIPIPASAELERVYGPVRKHNDQVDVTLLHALHAADAVDFLITQDTGLHKRANNVNVSGRVFRVEEALVWLRESYERQPVPLPYISEKQCHQLDQNDEVFKSLRSDYTGFNEWFTGSCVRSHRDCWTINFGRNIAGIAIRKDETLDDLLKDIPTAKTRFIKKPEKILKVCTFKIGEKYRGEKLGEQLLKQVLWWAKINQYEAAYLTVFPKHRYFIHILNQYGFEIIGRRDGELYLAKSFIPGVLATPPSKQALQYHRQYYPNFLDDGRVNKFLIPIKADYYQTLFPENVSSRQHSLFDQSALEGRTPGNSIRKVYVCRAQVNSIKAGDVLLFFHLKDSNSFHSQAGVTVGIVDGLDVTSSHEELLKLTAKRSVFSSDQLIDFTARDTKKVKVINFLLAGHVNPKVPFSRLEGLGLAGPYQSIRQISDEQYADLKPELNIDVKTQ